MEQNQTIHRVILRFGSSGPGDRMDDTIVRESLLRIVVDKREYAVVSMLPGQERELTFGQLLTGGLIASREDVQEWRYDSDHRTVYIDLNKSRLGLTAVSDRFSHCSTGSHQPAGISHHSLNPVKSDLMVSGAAILQMAASMRQAAGLFRETGAVHSAMLCLANGGILIRCDDISRHNACDKVIGAALLRGDIQAGECLMFCTCRLSSSIVSQAWCFGVPVLASRAAPTSRALEMAEMAGITIVGFIRDDRFNVYSGDQRILGAGKC